MTFYKCETMAVIVVLKHMNYLTLLLYIINPDGPDKYRKTAFISTPHAAAPAPVCAQMFSLLIYCCSDDATPQRPQKSCDFILTVRLLNSTNWPMWPLSSRCWEYKSVIAWNTRCGCRWDKNDPRTSESRNNKDLRDIISPDGIKRPWG